jgi:HSP20 family protein
MLTRWDPFADMASMRQAINRLFDDSFARPNAWSGSATASQFPFDLYETSDEVVLRVYVPGVDQEQLELVVNQGVLTLKGYRNFYSGEQEKQHVWHVRGMNEGNFQLAVAIPSAIDADAAEATYDQGIITVQLPKAETAKAKRIALKGQQEALTAGTR